MGRREANTGAMEKFIAEIDRFALIFREEQKEIERLAAHMMKAKEAYEALREQVKEAKELEHNTVSLLLKFISPGSIEILPLFDQMAPTDEKKQGKGAAEWRSEPITSLKLSSAGMRALIDADIVLVGQLQDLILGSTSWSERFPEITDGMAQAIELKLHEFVEGKKNER